MSLPATQTVGEIRQRAMDLEGIGRRGNARRNIKAKFTEEVIKAHRQLYLKHWWLRRRVVIEISLEEGIQVYNTPDQTIPGLFEHVWVTNSIGRVVELDPAIRPNERDQRLAETKGIPLLYWHENGLLHIAPEPDSEWLTMHIQCLEREMPVRNDQDFIQVDDVALLLKTQMAIRSYFGDGIDDLLREYQGYTNDLRASQGEGEGFQLGGHQSMIVRQAAQKRNRLTQRGLPQDGVYVSRDGDIYPMGGP